ncbi:MAG TPA: helix-turn-helix transcriptional regulator [Rhodothermales bacterium]|nr:helix-turn-helix transcriptional regulator [Rhodothermales bacterium]
MDHSIQNQIRARRKARGWTQQQLAQAVGVSRQSINAIERDRYVPSLPLALALTRVFGCTTEDLFSLERRPPPPLADLSAPMPDAAAPAP